MDKTAIEAIVAKVVAQLAGDGMQSQADTGIPVGVSNRHIHLSAEHLAMLFGDGHTLTLDRSLRQLDEFAAKETVTLVGPKGILRNVRVLGPVRSTTQVEISRTDSFALGIHAPLRNSGDIAKSAGIVIVGPHGAVTLREGVICAARHIHINQEDARLFGVADGSLVKVSIGGARGGTLDHVLVRVRSSFVREFHIDTDEANGLGLKNGDLVTLIGGEGG